MDIDQLECVLEEVTADGEVHEAEDDLNVLLTKVSLSEQFFKFCNNRFCLIMSPLC